MKRIETRHLPIAFKLHRSIDELVPRDWDALGDGHPAMSHAFLAALEHSGCIGPGTGWDPAYLAGRRAGELVAAVPLFQKWHSYGEYVFDWAWADAFQRHGLDYYPKWLVASPFSPLPGMRLLGQDREARQAALGAALRIAGDSGASSLHVLYATPEEAAWMQGAGMLLRDSVQFHWIAQGESDFDQFLARLRHDKRKKIRQERRRVAGYGLQFRWLAGGEADAAHWAFFHHCYENTYRAHHSTPYLNLDFFRRIARAMPDALRLLIASDARGPLAAALFLCSPQRLYGRYWGSIAELPCLHFELCYYRAIEYCLETGRAALEGGAQGEHKLARGMLPVTTRSAHWIADARFAAAIQRHLALERSHLADRAGELEARTPFRDEKMPTGPAGPVGDNDANSLRRRS